MGILDVTALEIGRRIKAKEIRVAEVVQAVFQRIAALEPTLGCYIALDEEGALKRVATVQDLIDKKTLAGPLAGVPVAVKDNLCVEGLATTCGSRILAGFVPTYTAQAVRSLEQAGAILVGKTNMDEFAMGSTTETSAYGVTKNPWNPEHVPGGSSGGSCAAVAAGECFYALGSDTGGSIRQPSAHCGVVGMKPTYGTVSRYGLVAYGSSLEQVGPIARDVSDCAAVLEVLASYDSKDSTSVRRDAYDFTGALVDDVRGMRIGIPLDYLGEGLDEGVRRAVLAAADVLKGKGAAVAEFAMGAGLLRNGTRRAGALPEDAIGAGLQPEDAMGVGSLLGGARRAGSLLDYAIPSYYIIACAEASSNLSRFDGVKYGYRSKEYGGLRDMYQKSRSEGFGTEVKRRIMLGSFVLSNGYYDAYYLKALKVRALVKAAFDRAFERFDVILAPVAPTTAPKLHASLQDPLQMYLGDIYTVAANLAGLPAMTVPCGRDGQGLPIGVQLIGDCYQERKIIRAGYAFEMAGEKGEGGGHGPV